MRVMLADLVQQYNSIKEEVDTAIADVVSSGRFILGPVVEQLEEEIARFSGARFGVGVNSGTDALHLAMVALGIGPGDEVITSPFTFVATAEMVSITGAKPVFADVRPDTFNLCPDSVESLITPRTKAIIPVDLFGQMADRTAFVALAEKHHLAIIWDSAQAIGSRFDDKPLGAFPGITTLSFFPTKNLGAYGDGGMVLTNDEAVRASVLRYRFHGSGGGYFYSEVGYCSRLDAIQAAVLHAKLKHLDRWNELRRAHADRYRELLAGTPVVLPHCDSRCHHTYHQFTIRHPERDRLKSYLAEHQVDTGIYYPLALHLQEAYRSLGYKPGDLPNAERAAAEVLSLPVHPEMTMEQVEYVSELIQRFA